MLDREQNGSYNRPAPFEGRTRSITAPTFGVLDLRGGGILRVLPLGGAEPSSRSRNVVWFVGPTRVAVALGDSRLVVLDVLTGVKVLTIGNTGAITTGLVECSIDMRKKAAAFKRAYAMRF